MEVILSKIKGIVDTEKNSAELLKVRDQLVKEKKLIDDKLRDETQKQFDIIMLNLKNLNQSTLRLNSIKANVQKVNQVSEESIFKLNDYELIKKTISIYQFFNTVENLYDDILKFKKNICNLHLKLKHEYQKMKEDMMYTLPNIFSIHYELNQTRNFSDYLKYFSKNLSEDLNTIINKLIFPVQRLVSIFDDFLSDAIFQMTEAAKKKNVEFIFKIIKIIDIETKEDLKFSLMESLNFTQSFTSKTFDYLSFRLQKRNYKSFFYKKLKQNVLENFNKNLSNFKEKNISIFEKIQWLEDEIRFLIIVFDPLFPENWNIGITIQSIYKECINNFTYDLINTDLPADELSKILSYDINYKKFINNLYQQISEKESNKIVYKKLSDSILNDDLKNKILDDYLKVIISRMREWNENLIKQEISFFVKRDSPPEVYDYHQIVEDENSEGEIIVVELETFIYVLPDFKTSLTILKEHTSVAVESGYSKILVDVIEEWSLCYIKKIEAYQVIVEEEYEKYISVYGNNNSISDQKKKKKFKHRSFDSLNKPTSKPISNPGLIEYLIALGNTYELNTDKLHDSYLHEFKVKSHKSFHSRIKNAFQNTLVPTTELNAQIIRTVVDIIMNDLYPALSIVFTDEWYYSSESLENFGICQKIAETVKEYMEEFKDYSSFEIYLVTLNVLLDSLIISYLKYGYRNIISGNSKKIDQKAEAVSNRFSDAIDRDVTTLYKNFEPLFTRKDSYYLLNNLRAIEFLPDLALCENPLEYIPELWENQILKTLNNCSVDYIKGICKCRKDLDKNQINHLCEKLLKIKLESYTYYGSLKPEVYSLQDFTF